MRSYDREDLTEAVERIIDDGDSVLDSGLIHPMPGRLLDALSMLSTLSICSCRTVDLEVTNTVARLVSRCGSVDVPSSKGL